MQDFLDEQAYRALQSRLQTGEVGLLIPRQVARSFFLRTPNAAIRQATGRSALRTKLLIWIGVITAPLLFVLAAAHFIQNTGWAAAILVPLLGIFWTILAGLTGDKGTFLQGTLAMILGLVATALMPTEYGVPIGLISLSLWIHRNVYFVAEFFLLGIVSQSFPAFDMLIEHIEILDNEAGEVNT